MRQTKKITLSAIMVALSVIFLTVGAVLSVADLTMAALASLVVVFVYIEIGSPYTFLVWLATSLLSFVFFPQSFAWMTYFLIFGIYPIIKAYIEKAPKILWLILRLVFFNAVFVALIFISELILGAPFFAVSELWIKIGLYVLCNLAFIVYDMFLTVMIRVYLFKFRSRFAKFLK